MNCVPSAFWVYAALTPSRWLTPRRLEGRKLQNSVATYLPLLNALVSFFTAVVVTFIGFRVSRSVETRKVRVSYLNYALQKIMDEYIKYDPVIDLSKAENSNYIRLIEDRFRECRASIRRVSPLIDQNSMKNLKDIDLSYSSIIRSQANKKLLGLDPDAISADSYGEMLTDYINSGHKILEDQIKFLRAQLEEGK